MEDIRRQEVRQLARLTARLDPTQQIFFQAEYSLHRRSPTTAFLLCILLGDFGAHYFYFGRYRAGLVRLLFCWTLVPAVWALFDARTMTARARRYNASLANELVLAIEGAVEEHDHALGATVDSAQRVPAVAAEGRRPALAAPPFTPEMEAIAAAAWVEREPQLNDPRDPPITLEELDATDNAVPQNGRWPNELARPVQPEHYALDMNEPHGSERDEPDKHIPVWPVAEAWLDEARAYPAHADDAAMVPDSEERASGGFMLDGVARESSGTEDATREPVMLYQVAPMPRRDSVHLEPPPPAAYLHDEEVQMDAAHHSHLTNMAKGDSGSTKEGHAARDEAAIAALGSVLASGLAELLRERPHQRPLTRPITRPITNSAPQPAAPAAPPPPPEPEAPDLPFYQSTLTEPANYSEPIINPSAADHADLLPLATPTAFAAGAMPGATDDMTRDGYAVDTSYGAIPLTPTPPEAPTETAARPDEANWLLGQLPAAAPLIATHAAMPAPIPVAPEPAVMPVPETVPLATNPAPASIAPPTAFNLRRRVVQRVIVRKMAVLDGHVVAEATVERQVPVIHDEVEMAARIRMATRDAAREALGYLLMQAPEEARPSIREQLAAMRQPTE